MLSPKLGEWKDREVQIELGEGIAKSRGVCPPSGVGARSQSVAVLRAWGCCIRLGPALPPLGVFVIATAEAWRV